jgi:hypothetical protein
MSMVLIFEQLLRAFYSEANNRASTLHSAFMFPDILVNPRFIATYHPLQEIGTLFILHPVLATSNT